METSNGTLPAPALEQGEGDLRWSPPFPKAISSISNPKKSRCSIKFGKSPARTMEMRVIHVKAGSKRRSVDGRNRAETAAPDSPPTWARSSSRPSTTPPPSGQLAPASQRRRRIGDSAKGRVRRWPSLSATFGSALLLSSCFSSFSRLSDFFNVCSLLSFNQALLSECSFLTYVVSLENSLLVQQLLFLFFFLNSLKTI